MDKIIQEVDFHYDETMRIGRLGTRIIPSVTEIVGQVEDGIRGDMEKGRAVHKAIELLNLGTLDWKTVDDTILPFVMGYEKFAKETGFKPSLIEVRLVHRLFGYHGQLDIEGTWDVGTRRVLVDCKKYAPGKATGLQLAGYELLLPERGGLNHDRIGLELKDDGSYKIHWFKEIEDRNVFLGLLALRTWKLNHGVGKVV